MPSYSIDAYNNADLSETFVNVLKPKNNLLQELKFFSDFPSDSKIAAVDFYLEDSSEIIVPSDGQRYGTDLNGITTRKTDFVMLELPMQATSTLVQPEDWQGKRKFGSTIEKTADDVVAEVLFEQSLSRDAYVEHKMSQALFGVQTAENTKNPNLDYQDLFNSRFQTSTLDLGSATADVPGWIARTRSQIRRRAGSLPIDNIFVFCPQEIYVAFLTHPSIKAMMVNTINVFDDRNFLTNYSTYGGLNDVQSFTFGGFVFVLVENYFYGMLGDSEILIAPKFKDGNLNPLRRYYTKASRDGEMAKLAPQTSYAYSYTTDNNFIRLVTECSCLCSNMLPGLYNRVTVTL